MIKTVQSIALLFLALSATCSFAQNAREASVSYKDKQVNAVMADYDAPQSVVENALKDRFDKLGFGSRKSEKGYNVYKATVWTSVSQEKLDVYTRIDGSGNRSTITILISKGYDNFIASASDADKVQKVEDFLNSFISDLKAYQLNVAIAAQAEVVKKADKIAKTSVSDGLDLAKEREKVDKKIADNKDDQAKKQAILDAETQKLNDLKGQVK